MHPIIKNLRKKSSDLKNQGLGNDVIRVQIKELLQNHILYAIYNHKKYKDLIFYGGTCLRKKFSLNRMSEDLDFETLRPIEFKALGEEIIKYFNRIELKNTYFSVQKGEYISRVTVKFPILNLLELSPHQDEALHVKVEINEKLTGIYETQLSPLMIDSLSLVLCHYNLETLMAGKILACLTRVFKKGKTGIEIKGRDFYDLIWFMQKGVIPNISKLKDGLRIENLKEVFQLLDQKVAKITERDLKEDLLPLFIEKNFVIDWCQNFHEFYNLYRKNY
ncbi:MAG: hypothetical protein GF335_02350 [Candidatus Moranbacteria bacterium]|nr:hypothetical protein [Candidatus Moranbacteria bacterium]